MDRKLAANSIAAPAVVCGIGGLALFVGFPLGHLDSVRIDWSESDVLWWDGLLSFAFFLQHSGMVRRRFQARVYRSIPPRYRRALYSIASGIALAAVALLWQRSNHHVLVLGPRFRWVALVPAVCAFALFSWGGLVLRNLDLFGNRAIMAHAKGTADPPPVFIVRGPYRWVRHPWYVAAILLFWSCADFTADRLLFNVLWSGWVCLGADSRKPTWHTTSAPPTKTTGGRFPC